MVTATVKRNQELSGTFVQLWWTAQCGNVDERSEANASNTTRSCSVVETTETENKRHYMVFKLFLNIYIATATSARTENTRHDIRKRCT